MQIDHLPAAPGIYRCQCRICEWTYNGLATNLRTRYKPKPGTEWHHNYLFNRCLAAGHEIVIDVLELCPEDKLLEREGYWQETLGCHVDMDAGGINLDYVDLNGTVRRSEQSKQKMSHACAHSPKMKQARLRKQLKKFHTGYEKCFQRRKTASEKDKLTSKQLERLEARETARRDGFDTGQWGKDYRNWLAWKKANKLFRKKNYNKDPTNLRIVRERNHLKTK